jgi:hypothetical protein
MPPVAAARDSMIWFSTGSSPTGVIWSATTTWISESVWGGDPDSVRINDGKRLQVEEGHRLVYPVLLWVSDRTCGPGRACRIDAETRSKM